MILSSSLEFLGQKRPELGSNIIPVSVCLEAESLFDGVEDKVRGEAWDLPLPGISILVTLGFGRD